MKYTPPASPEEKLFTARIADLIRKSQKTGMAEFSAFLNLRERELAAQTVSKLNAEADFFGGYDGAERVMLCVKGECEEDFPIVPLDFTVYGEFDHRDVLGSVLALGLTREPVGDILMGENGFRIFVSDRIADFLKTELKRIGRMKAEYNKNGEEEFFTPRFEEDSDTVASLRLDSVVASIANLSRGDATALIERGYVSVNHLTVEKITLTVETGDVISVRTKGKYRIDDTGKQTKKGRTVLRYSKYL